MTSVSSLRSTNPPVYSYILSSLPLSSFEAPFPSPLIIQRLLANSHLSTPAGSRATWPRPLSDNKPINRFPPRREYTAQSAYSGFSVTAKFKTQSSKSYATIQMIRPEPYASGVGP